MLRGLYRSAEAVLMPGEEDFGIVPLEAQACGTPVIALGRGGALETVRDGSTGILMPESGPAALLAAIDRLRTLHLDPAAAVANAARFSRAVFRDAFRRALESARARAGPSDGKMPAPVPA
jgi:glycosyltransferase involved in cell wall biosynthesis